MILVEKIVSVEDDNIVTNIVGAYSENKYFFMMKLSGENYDSETESWIVDKWFFDTWIKCYRRQINRLRIKDIGYDALYEITIEKAEKVMAKANNDKYCLLKLDDFYLVEGRKRNEVSNEADNDMFGFC